MRRGISDILAHARARLSRLTPRETLAAQQSGAIVVDIRPVEQRRAHGEIPGAVVIDRNVLEWRLDPASDARLPLADNYDLSVIVVCQQGYSSSLAAATLQEIGLHRATDMAGGFEAWQASGLPIQHA
ncbi:MAG TPA: rhodanese-like domain-containing protein [Candidatus Limnocylindrales bacterium]